MTAPLPKSRFRLIWRGLLVISLILGSCLLAAYSLSGPRPHDQEITFKHATPQLSPVATLHSKPPPWLRKTYEAFDTLKSKFTRLSTTPKTTPQLEQSVEFWYPKLLLRYPQLAVPMKTLPDAENGFLQLLNLMDRVKAENRELPFPIEITNYLENKGPWPTDLAEKWLTRNQARVAEIHAIGLIGDRSLNHIPIERWFLISSESFKLFTNILILKARLAAERGEVTVSLEAVRAARGLADHLSEIESPTFLMAMLKIFNQRNLSEHVLSDIIPALPAGQVHPTAWESALRPTPSEPGDYIRLVKGEWNAGVQHFLFLCLLDSNLSGPNSDGGDLLDYYSLHHIEICNSLESATLRDFAILECPPLRDASHLSATSQVLLKTPMALSRSLFLGWRDSQSITAMTQAAFAIMRDQPIPKDPIYGMDYQWDAATRHLSPPAIALDDTCIIVPQVTH